MNKIIDRFKDSGINYWVSTPSFANVCCSEPGFCDKLLKDLRMFFFCGETLTNNTALKLRERFPNAKIINMVNRTMALYKGDSSMTKTLENYNDVYLYHKNTYFEKKFCNIRQSFINDRDNISVLAAMKLSNISPGMKKHISDDPPDWGSLEHKSELYSASRSTNKFFMYDKAYAKSFKKKVFSQRRMNKHRNLTISREYYDLSCFLKICKESKIKPLIIILPMNGYWYDHVGFPIERRLNFDNKVKEEAKDYGASIADFTYDEYNPYFMEDAVHLSAKGWVKVNESIFKFYKNDN